jgi:hypothetical protein
MEDEAGETRHKPVRPGTVCGKFDRGNRMKIKFLVGALVLLIVVNLAVIGTFVAMNLSRRPPEPGMRGIPAVAPHGDRERRRPRFPAEHREELVAQLRELREETEPMREKMAALEEEMFVELRADSVDEVLIDSLLLEISAIQLDMRKAATRKLLKSREILPPEHRDVFFRAMLNARKGRVGMMEHRGDGPPRGRRGRRVPPDSLGRQ